MSAGAGRALAAPLTAPGRGAVAVVRVWGPGALAAADTAFRPHRGPRLAETPPGRPRVGRVGPEGAADEVVAVVEGDPPEVEIHPHGGPAAVALVLDALAAAGATATGPDAWLARSAPSPTRADALADLARAPTLRAAEVLLEQARGAFDAELIRLADLPTAEALAGVEVLGARGGFGTRLVDGWRVALAGRPNAGKSRLLNALAGFERAIVAPEPGTTRDALTVRTALDGLPVELIDTAGLRDAADPIEAAGIERARARQAEADLVLLLLDRSAPRAEADRGLIEALPEALRIASKADLPAALAAEWAGALPVSAETGAGIDGLVAAVVARLVADPPPPGAAVPFRVAQVRTLEAARRALLDGRAREASGLLRRLAGVEPSG